MPRPSPRKRATKQDREAVGALRERGFGVMHIARLLQLDRHFVRKWHHSQLTYRHVKDSPRSGRPPKRTTTLQQRVRQRLQSGARSSTRKVAAALGVSQQTVLRAAADEDIHPFHPPIKPSLTDAQRAGRLAFAKEHRDDDWSDALFTDEKRFDPPSLLRTETVV